MRSRAMSFSRLIAMLLLALGLCVPLRASLPPIPPPAPAASAAPQADDVAATERSVVRVVTVAIVNGEVVGFGHGSGFAIAPNRIVTNAHVVGDAAEFPQNVVIGIVPSEGTRSYPGRLIRLDRRRDLAIVELERGRLPAASIYTGPVAQREAVYALGYPGNVDVATAQSMDDFIRPRAPVASDGIVSATDAINGVAALVHDADIARGNSGGPLVDACGRVIGVNTFISRADDGDSPFSFAVSVRELAQFLQDAGQRFTGVASDCLTLAEAQARAGALDADARAAAEVTRQRDAAREAARAQELERLKGDAQNRRETFIALAALLLGGAVLGGAAAIMYHGQGKLRERRAAMMAAGLFVVAALIIFLLRPDPSDVRLPAPEEEAGEASAEAAAGPLTGTLACTVDRDRGRITVSAGEDTAFRIDGDGCVNGRTQYVAGEGGIFTRTLVPNEEATVSRLSYDPATGEYVVRRYLLNLEPMEALRRERARTEIQGCTADPARIAALAAREASLAAMLPERPNEEIVSRCRASALQAGSGAP
jgi:S1-C subfamily serine protease